MKQSSQFVSWGFWITLAALIVVLVLAAWDSREANIKRIVDRILGQALTKADASLVRARRLSSGRKPTYSCMLSHTSTASAVAFCNAIGLGETKDRISVEFYGAELNRFRRENHEFTGMDFRMFGGNLNMPYGVHAKAAVQGTNTLLILLRF